MADNPVEHSRTKHIAIRYHFLRDHQQKGDIEIAYINTKEQLADIFTKPLDEQTLKTSFFVKLGGGAVLLLWANTFSPFGMNRQKRILVSEISKLISKTLLNTKRRISLRGSFV